MKCHHLQVETMNLIMMMTNSMIDNEFNNEQDFYNNEFDDNIQFLYSPLSHMVKDYLIQATSVSSEQMFSIAKHH